MNKITTAMDRVTVRFLRTAKAPWGAGSADFGPGDRAALPAEVARALIARGDAVMDSERPVVVQKGLDSIIVELPAAIAVTKSASGARRFRAVASTGAVDRAGDVVEPGGWKLANYRKIRVILLAHDVAALPVARATGVFVEGRALMLEAEFPQAGVSARSDEAWALVEVGLLGAVSVGFVPLKSEPRRDAPGWRYLEQDLVEISLVATPANPEALIVPPLLAQRSAAETTQPKSARKLSGRTLFAPARVGCPA